MRKVLFVVDEKQMGGVSVLLEDILKMINLSKYKIDILVLHNNGDYLDDLPVDINVIYGTSFFDVVDLTFKEILKSKNIIKTFKKIYLIFLMKTSLIRKKIIKERKKCLKEKYDVEIAFKDGFTAIFTAFGDSNKKYHWLHTDYKMYDCTANYHGLFKNVFPIFDRVIGISNSVVKRFLEKYPDIKYEVIYNVIDSKKIKNKSNDEEIKFKEKINFISVGRFHYMKGYDRLINVFKKLNDNNELDNIVLRIIGDGPDFQKVKTMIVDNKLENKVILLGRMKNPFCYVKASDAFIMCSRYEPFGLVVLESLILKTPVISVDVASISEIMNDKYGIISKNSEEGLYNALKTIIENPVKLDVYKNNLLSYNYNVTEIINKIEKLLDEV